MSVNLQKGQKISLEKEAGTSLNRVIMGLGWDVIQKKGFFGFGGGTKSVDLDASCIIFNEKNEVIDCVWFRQLKSTDGSIQHTGDNRTGEGDGDDEQIIVELSKVSPLAKSLVFTVNSFTGQDFSEIENAYCRLLNGSNQQEIARYNLSAQGVHTAQIMAKLYRHEGVWKMHAIGENGKGRTFDELMPQILPYI